jgi:proline iminopeptidase
MILKFACLMAFSSFLLPSQSQCQGSPAAGDHVAMLNGVRIWYKIAGQERPGQAPVLFLHGGPGYNSYSFERTIGAQLEPHMQLIYLDERGSGRSERPADQDYSMSTLVADVEALRVSLGVPRITVMGHSFGGTIALEYAARYPQHVQKLIILDGAADIPETIALWRHEIAGRYPDAWKRALDTEAGKKLQQAQALGECEIARTEFATEMVTLHDVDGEAFHNWQQFHDQRYQREQSKLDQASGLRNTGELGGAYFSPTSPFLCYRFNAFDRLTMPTLIAVGKYDGAIGADQMKSLANHLPNARFDEFHQSAHFIYAEEPAKFVHDITAFVAEK